MGRSGLSAGDRSAIRRLLAASAGVREGEVMLEYVRRRKKKGANGRTGEEMGSGDLEMCWKVRGEGERPGEGERG
jgi:hypothetical protein